MRHKYIVCIREATNKKISYFFSGQSTKAFSTPPLVLMVKKTFKKVIFSLVDNPLPPTPHLVDCPLKKGTFFCGFPYRKVEKEKKIQGGPQVLVGGKVEGTRNKKYSLFNSFASDQPNFWQKVMRSLIYRFFVRNDKSCSSNLSQTKLVCPDISSTKGI